MLGSPASNWTFDLFSLAIDDSPRECLAQSHPSNGVSLSTTRPASTVAQTASPNADTNDVPWRTLDERASSPSHITLPDELHDTSDILEYFLGGIIGDTTFLRPDQRSGLRSYANSVDYKRAAFNDVEELLSTTPVPVEIYLSRRMDVMHAMMRDRKKYPTATHRTVNSQPPAYGLKPVDRSCKNATQQARMRIDSVISP